MLRKNVQTDIKNMFENNWKQNDRSYVFPEIYSFL